MKNTNRSKQMYEEFVCPHCFYQIDQCTCEHYPPRSLIHIDLEIQEIIRILNHKGYCTRYCCAGHGDEYKAHNFTEIYISFPYPQSILRFDTLPAGFTEDKRDCVIRCHFPKKLSEEQFAAYHKAALDNLYLWAQNLPVFDEKAAREQEYRIRESEREKRKAERSRISTEYVRGR